MISKVKPDNQKSQSLKKMAEITLERLNNTEIEKYPSNTLLDYYDIIHKLLESLTLKEGIKVRGEGAHQELIDFVSTKYSFDDQTRQFLQQMRDYRNRISYEGFMVHRNYILLNKKTIINIIQKLFNLIKST